MNILKNRIAEKLNEIVELETEQILKLIEIPPNPDMGDIAFPCFKLSKIMRKNPAEIAQELAQKLSGEDFDKVEAKGPYVNFFFSIRLLAKLAFQNIADLMKNDFKVDIFNGKTVTIDYSSPNIAKEFSIGHLRATSLGHSIALLMKLANANLVSINHLGDWGTQFGVLVYAYQQEGNEAELKDEPILALQTLYRKYSLRMKAEKARMRSRDENVEWNVKRALDIDEGAGSDEILAEKLAQDEYLANPQTADAPESVTEMARKTFSKLEHGDDEIRAIWQKFRELSINRLKEIYAEMNIEFDHYHGEAFYEDKMPAMLDLIREKNVMKLDQGAQIIDLGAKKTPAIIIKTNGGTTYVTRDITAAKFRKDSFGFYKNLYVVDARQTQHFQQMKDVLRKLGFDWADDCVHIPFGAVKVAGKIMKNREGNVILLSDFLKINAEQAQAIIDERSPDNIEDTTLLAKQIGMGAIIFEMLRVNRTQEVDYRSEDAVKFEGNTGPRVQMINARMNSVIRNFGAEIPADFDMTVFDSFEEKQIFKLMLAFEDRISSAVELFEPAIIAHYLLDIADWFNRLWKARKFITDDEKCTSARMNLVKALQKLVETLIKSLGIQTPTRM